MHRSVISPPLEPGSLFAWKGQEVPYKADGATFDHARDSGRLGTQQRAVRDFLLAHRGAFFTVAEIRAAIGGIGTETSISARVRDLRKARHGGYVIDARRRSTSLWEFALQ